MKKSELRQIIKEKLKKPDYFMVVTNYLRTKIYPKLNDDELYDLNIRLRDWFNKNI